MANVKRASALCNDPAIGAIFENLGSMFAPPKASDTYAYAKARQTQNETNTTAAGWAAIDADQNLSPEQKGSLKAMGAPGAAAYAQARLTQQALTTKPENIGNLDPLSYAVGHNANNTFTGQGRKLASDERASAYGNDQALIGAIYGTDMKTGLDREKFYQAPQTVKPGETTAFTPTFQQQSGLGPTLSGTPIPLSETQDKAAEAARLRASGQITDQDMVDTIMGAHAPVKALDANNRPIYATPGAAARQGLSPAPNDVAPSDLGKLQQERDFIQATSPHGANDPRVAEINTRIGKLGAGGTTVNVGAGEKALDTGFAAADVKDITAATDAQEEAIRASAKNDILRESLKAGPSGLGAGIQAYLSDKGIKFGENAGAIELSQALISSAIPSQRIAGSGTTSDRDMALFAKSLPQILNTPDGNAAILDLHQAMNQRTIKIGDLATQARDREITPAQFRAAVRALPDPLVEFNMARAASGAGMPAASAAPTTPTPAAPSAGGRLRFDANGNVAK